MTLYKTEISDVRFSNNNVWSQLFRDIYTMRRGNHKNSVLEPQAHYFEIYYLFADSIESRQETVCRVLTL